jgi:diaminopimelate decarboxylase
MKCTGTVDWHQIAAEYGTPTYVYQGEVLAAHVRELRAALHPSLEVFFSLKSNPNRAIFELLHANGARAEVSSLAELRTALAAGADSGDIIFLGPGKSDQEIASCVEERIYAIVCESFQELARIECLGAERGVRQRVLLRINPAYSVSGSRLTMGGKPRQFGIDESAVLEAGHLATRFRYAELAGIQVYLGTRILDPGVVVRNTEHVLALAGRVAEITGMPLDTVDIGGGLGVAYFDGEEDLDIPALAKELNPLIGRFAAAHPATRLIMESGRFLTACAGTYLMRVRYTKHSMGERFAITDGGTHHHMAAVGIGSFVKRNFPVELLGRAGGHEPPIPWNIAGPLCTPNDTIARKALLPPLQPGDLLGIQRSGAYGPTASPVFFLSHGYPAEVLLWRGQPYLIRARDTVTDLLAKHISPPIRWDLAEGPPTPEETP